MDYRPLEFGALMARITRALRDCDVPFMLIGGQAVLLHGRPRLTEDIDITLGTGPEGLTLLLGVCKTAGLSPLPENVEQFVRETFVLPAADPDSGIRIDFIFSTTPYERTAIGRAVLVEIGDESVPFASAEDLIIHKLFAGRAHDLEDAASVVRLNWGELDWDYMTQWAKSFSEVPGREDLPAALQSLRESERS